MRFCLQASSRHQAKASKPLVFALALLAAFLYMGTPASAQGLLDFLFGSPKPQHRPAAIQRLTPPPGHGYGLPLNQSSRTFSAYPSPQSRSGAGGGTYRTMCVRLCDGYYFPINYRTSSGYLHRDADACRSRCGAEARLFYYPTGSDDMRNAVDQSGRSYRSLKTAFLYRKKYDSSCTCRPHPWTSAELERHRRYAGKSAGNSSQQATAVEPAPTAPVSMSGAPAVNEQTQLASAADLQPDPVERPEPVADVVPPAGERSGSVAVYRTSVRTPSRAQSRSSPRPVPSRPLQAVTARPSATRKSSPPASFWSLPASSGQQYVWPGDAPPRRR